MKKLIVVKTQFEAVHNWPDCDLPNVEYLKQPHRHIFHVTVKCPVVHNNRQAEFHTQKRLLDLFISSQLGFNLGSMSCEDIAEKILKTFGASFVSVFEDNENGAEIYAD